MVKLDPHIQFFMCPGPFPGSSYCKASTCNAGDLGREGPLEKDMATYSSILAWRIPWLEEPGGLSVYGVAESTERLPPPGIMNLLSPLRRMWGSRHHCVIVRGHVSGVQYSWASLWLSW